MTDAAGLRRAAISEPQPDPAGRDLLPDHQLADTMIEVLASAGPVARASAATPDDYRYRPEVFHDEAGGVL
ncbi:hypothetical protein [Streptomyces sp. Ru62]|uniref:hypothetical protein n=1 Tax=Streptomyces sp. Ru62 TaxID=2080745 RepID=UPI001CA5B42B|nr:hypothetical protein [Streptomyces sp. Ru62]